MGTHTKAPDGTASALIEVAARNVGFIEGPKNNENPYAPLVGHANYLAWCASFVAACCLRAGVAIPSNSPYTPAMANGFKKAGRYDKTPKRGSIVFFFWPNMGRIAHVGIVESVNADGSVNTIEGNTNGAGSRTGGMVTRLVRRSNIDGYGHPEFAAEPAADPVKPTPVKRSRQVEQAKAKKAAPVKGVKNPYAVPVLTKTRPVIRASSRKTKAEVKFIQWAVGAKDDGEWGKATSQAVKTFQQENGMVVDGEVGPKTLAVLKAVVR